MRPMRMPGTSKPLIGSVRVASIYLPNGNPIDTDKFSYKLAWMDRLIAHVRTLLAYEEAVGVGRRL